jgi:hypothetical protein
MRSQPALPANQFPDTALLPAPRSSPDRATMSSCGAILAKEFYHIRRRPTTIFFMLVISTLQIC